MNARDQFKRGLWLIGWSLLATGWATWCHNDKQVWSGSNDPFPAFLERQWVTHDFGAFAITIVITVLFLRGLLTCVDALVWNPNQLTRTEAAQPAGQAPRPTALNHLKD